MNERQQQQMNQWCEIEQQTSGDSQLKGVLIKKYDRGLAPLRALAIDASLDFVCLEREIDGFNRGDDGWFMFPRIADFFSDVQLDSPFETKITNPGFYYQWIRPGPDYMSRLGLGLDVRCKQFFLRGELRNDPAFDRQQLEHVLWDE